MTPAGWSELVRCEERDGHERRLSTVVDPASGVRHCATDAGLVAAFARAVLDRPKAAT